MRLAKLDERRRDMRRALLGDCTGRLLVSRSGRAIACLAVDVSAAGLRIISTEELAAGTAMWLVFEGHCLPMVVAWCRPEGNRVGRYGCGLMTTDADLDLEAFFASIGWLETQTDFDAWLGDVEFVERSEE